MKLISKFSFLIVLSFAFACGTDRTGNSTNGDIDSNEIAEEANEDKFEKRDDRKDADFVADEVADNYAELQLAKLASQKATHAEVKSLAKLMETQHAKSLQELQTLASKKAITVPTEPDDQAKRKIDDLREEEKAEDFNKEWTKEMVDMHEKKIEEYEDRLESTEDADLKAWITQTLPHLRTHLDKLKACNDKLKDA